MGLGGERALTPRVGPFIQGPKEQTWRSHFSLQSTAPFKGPSPAVPLLVPVSNSVCIRKIFLQCI